MITFRQYLTEEELSKTKRKSIIHLQDMKPVEALEFIHSIASDLKGKLKNIPVKLKIDGAGMRFGKDSKGRYFFETSNSGPIQKSKSFSSYTKERGGDEIQMTRSLHYDDMYDVIEKSGIWKMLPDNSKLVVEIMYNPMASEQDDKLKFVSVKYDKNKLGKLMTIVPIALVDASSGEHLENEDEIIKQFIKQSSSDIKIISPDLGKLNIDISAELNPYSLIGPDAEFVLKSLKKADKEKKNEYKQIISEILNNIASSVLAHPIKGKDVLGDEIEGYVLEINGKLFKITTPKFKQQKKDERIVKENKTLADYGFKIKKTERITLLSIIERLVPPLEEPGEESIPDFNLQYTQKAGTFNQKLIYSSGFFGSKYVAFVIFDENKKAQSFVVLQIEPELLAGKERTIVKRSWTRNDSQRQGLATTIYSFLVKKLDLQLVCDNELSSNSISVYKNFISKNIFDKIFFYNEKTKEVQETEPDDIWIKNTNWRIMLENFENFKPNPLFGQKSYRQLQEYILDFSDLD